MAKTANKKTKKPLQTKDTVADLSKLNEVVDEKHKQEDAKVEEKKSDSIENGTGIVIILSGDILIGGLLFKRNVRYKITKEQFVTLEKHTRILGVAMQLL